MRSERVDALRASIYPLTATFTPQPPLTRSLEATTPLTSPSRVLGTLTKLTSITETTGVEYDPPRCCSLAVASLSAMPDLSFGNCQADFWQNIQTWAISGLDRLFAT